MGKGFITIKTSAPSSETIKDIDAAVVVVLQDKGDQTFAKISVLSTAAMDERMALIHALQPIANKIRSFGRCCPKCEGCAIAIRIADGVDALICGESDIPAATVRH